MPLLRVEGWVVFRGAGLVGFGGGFVGAAGGSGEEDVRLRVSLVGG